MAFRVRKLTPDTPADAFPDPATAGVALGYPEGLLAIGGDLSPQRLLAAYQRGIFPWFNDDQPILWWSPDPRAVIFPQAFHMSRSLARMLRDGAWEVSLNQEFATVMSGCAENRGRHGSWITADMRHAYQRLHTLGYAHSLESWYQGRLAGGIYGIRLGRVFFGESMFSAHNNGSKVAISGLIQLCLDEDIRLLDCQLESRHLRSLGMQSLSRTDFVSQLPALTAAARPHTNWAFSKRPAAHLATLRKTAKSRP